VACLLCLTGDVYNQTVGADGYLTTWPQRVKIAAAIVLVISVLFMLHWFK
jgi:hypothetical protein